MIYRTLTASRVVHRKFKKKCQPETESVKRLEDNANVTTTEHKFPDNVCEKYTKITTRSPEIGVIMKRRFSVIPYVARKPFV